MPVGKNTDAVRLNKVIPRVETSAERGLSPEDARERLENGYANIRPDSPEKTFAEILRGNIFTYFNLVFTVLALCVIAVGQYRDLTFMPVVIINSLIGILQELRSKRALAKLTFIAAPKAAVIRGGKTVSVPAHETVLDDVSIFTAGNQIYADAVVLAGECYVNEALVTGESDEIKKTAGDALLSGSYVVSGECRARLDKVGGDSFVSKLTVEAKKSGKKRTGAMMTALYRLVRVIGIIILPLGLALFFRQTIELDMPVPAAMVSTVAALIGMIPEGLYLLVSIALTVSVMRLARRKTLVHEMGCIETLARVDVLCVDKTGTITQPEMEFAGMYSLCPDRFTEEDISAIMRSYTANMDADNETIAALKNYFKPALDERAAVKTQKFSSEKKYSGVSFHAEETYLLGAPEKLLPSRYELFREEIERYSAGGFRVLLLALYDSDCSNKVDDSLVMPLALIKLQNTIRPNAAETFRFFAEQGVRIVVISGDNPFTVSQVAQDAGIENAGMYIDASTLTTEKKLVRAAADYTVFGRVTPEQKRRLVRALKTTGSTVAMTGDGVNDVLALREADCSIAMASGSDVASKVSDLVLLESDFSSMPDVVMEGRRVINNIERSAALYLVKNIFSFLLAVVTMSFALPYPITPSQLTLFNVMLIGIPSFVFAMEPSHALVRGSFIKNVLRSAAPAGITDFIALGALILLSARLGIPAGETQTISTIVIAFVGFMMLYKLGRPLNTLRTALIAAMLLGFILGGVLFHELFALVPLTKNSILLTIAICLGTVPVMPLLAVIINNITSKRGR